MGAPLICLELRVGEEHRGHEVSPRAPSGFFRSRWQREVDSNSPPRGRAREGWGWGVAHSVSLEAGTIPAVACDPSKVGLRQVSHRRRFIHSGDSATRKGGLASLWCILTQLENVVKTGLKLVFPMLLGRSVICDRYVLDMLVDGMYGLHDSPGRKRLGFKLLRLFPRPDFAFFMDIDPEVAFKRKPDLPTLKDYVERLDLYRMLSSRWGVTIVNARSQPNVIRREIWDSISRSTRI